jgi:hypothetical protein
MGTFKGIFGSMSGLIELEEYCLKAIDGGLETRRIEIKGCLDISNDKFQAEFIQTLAAIANTDPDTIVPYGLLIVGVHKGKAVDNVEQWLKDENEYQNLMRKYCDPSVRFSLHKLERNRKKFGVFVIDNDQDRPHFVKENLVVKEAVLLARGQIYVRNGSETVVALKREFKEHIISDFDRRIQYSLKELSTKDRDILGGEIIPNAQKLGSETLNETKIKLMKNINNVRRILEGAY